MLKKIALSLTFISLVFIASVHFANAQTETAKLPTLKTYVLADGRFSIELPDEPSKSNETDESLSTDDYSTDTDKGSFTVTEMSSLDTSIAGDAEFANTIKDAFFDAWSEEIQKSEADGFKIEIGEVKDIEWNGLKGHQQIIKVDGISNYARVYISDRIYLMNAISEIPGLSEKVLNSFKISEQKAK